MNVGKIFVENVELFQAYEMYCSRQPEAMSLLESLQKKNDVLRVFLNVSRLLFLSLLKFQPHRADIRIYNLGFFTAITDHMPRKSKVS